MKTSTLMACLLAPAIVACADSPTTQLVNDQPSYALSKPPTGPTPTGERIFHNTGLEAVYDAEHSGNIGYVSTPVHAPMHANDSAWAPIYIVVYPQDEPFGTLLCQDDPVENCPDHGPEIAGLAAVTVPDVYGNGVKGHDHIMDYPGGDDFNIAWEPIVVLFTNSEAANTMHLLTDAAIDDAVANGDAIEIPLPSATFHCAPVPARIWDMGTPVGG
jgi:hypothetical protein